MTAGARPLHVNSPATSLAADEFKPPKQPPGTARRSCACARAARSSSPATARSRWARPSSSPTPARCAGSAAARVIAGFAGATADAITLFERLEAKLEQYSGQLTRACVELAKDWRTDRYLRRLEAMMAVADKNVSLILSGTGDVLEPEDGIIGIGSGGGYALAAARALIDVDGLDAETIARRAMAIAAGDLHLYQRQDHPRKAAGLIDAFDRGARNAANRPLSLSGCRGRHEIASLRSP